MLQSYTLDDDLALADRIAMEVTVTLTDGRRGWCFFMTPGALANAGDWVAGTEVRVHFGVPHMIIVSELSRDIIEHVLRQLDTRGDLLQHIRIEV